MKIAIIKNPLIQLHTILPKTISKEMWFYSHELDLLVVLKKPYSMTV